MKEDFTRYPGVITCPDRVGGKPTLGESRVSAELIADCLDHGETPEEIAYNYSLPITAVLNFRAHRDAYQLALKY